MNDSTTSALETADTTDQIDDRDVRALTEYMSVLEEGGDIYTVVGQNGGTYTVDARAGRCTCPDHKHRDVRCKHQRRVAFATAARPVPPIDRSELDPDLGQHVPATPQFAATDGGDEILEAGDDGEILNDDEDGRPDDCDCAAFHTDTDLPCWPCYREGFDEPAGAEPAAEEQGDGDTHRHELAGVGAGDSASVQEL